MSATTLSVFSTTCAARTAGWALSGSSTDALNIDRSIPRFAAVYITRDLHRFSHMLRQLCSIGVRGNVEFVGGTGCICDRVVRVGAARQPSVIGAFGGGPCDPACAPPGAVFWSALPGIEG